jgi:hypothetical protein
VFFARLPPGLLGEPVVEHGAREVDVMEPTFHVGAEIVFNTEKSTPKVGQVLLFHPPQGASEKNTIRCADLRLILPPAVEAPPAPDPWPHLQRRSLSSVSLPVPVT